MPAYFVGEKKTRVVPDKALPSIRAGTELSEYLFKTALDGVLSALPLSCRKMVMASDGVLFQLALIALIQSEKEQKKLHIAKHKGKKNKLVVQAVIKKVKAELGLLRKKVKRIKKELKEKKGKHHLGKIGKHKLTSKKKLKVVKKSSLKKKAKKKPIKLLRLIKLKKGKKKVVKFKGKMSAKRLAKLSNSKANKTPKTKNKIKPSKKTFKKTKLKFSLKKGKLSFLIKPDGKAMGKVAKKQYAKKRRAQFLKLSLLEEKRERAKAEKEYEKAKKSKVANAASFFKKGNQGKTEYQARKKQNKIRPGFKNITKTSQHTAKKIKHSA